MVKGIELNKDRNGIKIGFDIDGVIANYGKSIKTLLHSEKIEIGRAMKKLWPEKTDFSLTILSEEQLVKLTDSMLESVAGKKVVNAIYANRAKNQPIVDLINRLKEEGYEIVLITAFADKKITEEWLEANKVGYDQLENRAIGSEISKYKVNKIKELGVQFYIDDREETIKTIESDKELSEVTTLYYRETEEIKIDGKIITKAITAKMIAETAESIIKKLTPKTEDNLSEISRDLNPEFKNKK